MKKEPSSFIVTTSKLVRDKTGALTQSDYYIEGGFNKLEEAALRCLQGLMPVCFNGKAFMSNRLAVTAAFDYAEEFLRVSAAKRDETEELKTTPAGEESLPTPPKLILS